MIDTFNHSLSRMKIGFANVSLKGLASGKVNRVADPNAHKTFLNF